MGLYEEIEQMLIDEKLIDPEEEKRIEEIEKHLCQNEKKMKCQWGDHDKTICYPILCPVSYTKVWYCESCCWLAELCRQAIDKDKS